MALLLFPILLFAAIAGGAATLTLHPSLQVPCANGLGTFTVSWADATGPVEVRIGDPRGTSMTGVVAASGSASTGAWVSDQMRFFLVNTAGRVEASATASTRCGLKTSLLPSDSYLPLAVGNLWVYRYNDRSVTSLYVTRSIPRTEELGNKTYFVIESGPLPTQRLRADADGKIYRFTGTVQAPREEVFLDPASLVAAPFSGLLGEFPDAQSQRVVEVLGRQDSVFVRGIGMVQSVSTMTTGSSGGFVSGLSLVEARMGGLHISAPANRLSLSLESKLLDVSGRTAPSCNVPSHCIACVPSVAYKPCMQARIEGFSNSDYTLELELTNQAGQTVYRSNPIPGETGLLLRYVQVPLDSAPNVFLPPGTYSLTGKLRRANELWIIATATVQIL